MGGADKELLGESGRQSGLGGDVCVCDRVCVHGTWCVLKNTTSGRNGSWAPLRDLFILLPLISFFCLLYVSVSLCSFTCMSLHFYVLLISDSGCYSVCVRVCRLILD